MNTVRSRGRRSWRSAWRRRSLAILTGSAPELAEALHVEAATRLKAFVASGGTYVYGSYADIDGLFREQAAELDRKRREAMLHRIQQLVHEKAMFAPIWQLAVMGGFGPRVEEPGLGLITGYTFSGPYEDVRLKGK